MIVPSIDLMDGRAVQLVGGETLEIDAGDPTPIAERFSRVGEIAVIDLDAALGRGSNAEVIRELCARYPCRVGGGIRSVDAALGWLDAGARSVILGTAAEPDVLSRLPRDRVIAALDCKQGEVVVEGWQTKTGRSLLDRIDELREHVGGFLVTTVEREGRMAGADLELARTLAERCGDARVTLAGGVTTAEEIAQLDRMGLDAQVGMAIYRGDLPLADAFAGPVRTDRPDGLIPTVVADQRGICLGLVYSSRESLAVAVEEGRGVYHSRSRGGLWRKGETSGNTQRLVRIDVDCDRDTLRFVVEQAGGFCHTGSATCFGDLAGLGALDETIGRRLSASEPGSYTERLVGDAALLRSKLLEEANELLDADTTADAAHEAADVIYFAMVAARARGAPLADIERELDQRAARVTRRPGNAKPGSGEAL
ncbi:MAG: phosphoribosyl-ATP diphosphatase [Planctomycetota bacterium]